MTRKFWKRNVCVLSDQRKANKTTTLNIKYETTLRVAGNILMSYGCVVGQRWVTLCIVGQSRCAEK